MVNEAFDLIYSIYLHVLYNRRSNNRLLQREPESAGERTVSEQLLAVCGQRGSADVFAGIHG